MHAESSEALLVGQKPKMQLLLRGVDQIGQHISSIEPLLTNDFVVSSNNIELLIISNAVMSVVSIAPLLIYGFVVSFDITSARLTDCMPPTQCGGCCKAKLADRKSSPGGTVACHG